MHKCENEIDENWDFDSATTTKLISVVIKEKSEESKTLCFTKSDSSNHKPNKVINFR